MVKLSEKTIGAKKMDRIEVATAASEAATAGKLTLYAGGATSAVAWWQAVDWLAIGGITLALLGFLMNFYFSYQKNKREQLEHELRLKSYEDKQ